jgi:hypothetical protein
VVKPKLVTRQSDNGKQTFIVKKDIHKFMAKGPCWKGYQMVGMKKKGGKNVPNCVPKK